MNEVLEVLKYTLPAIIVFLTAFFILRAFIKKEKENKKHEILVNNQKYIQRVRLQAYERCILFLERISPESMIKRMHKQGVKSNQFQSLLLSTVRAEFEHNFAQQLYVSHEAWQLIVKTKEMIIKLINTTSGTVNPESPSFNLSKAILEKVMEMDQKPTAAAIRYLKKEVQQFF